MSVSDLGGEASYLASVTVQGNVEDLNHLRQYLTQNNDTAYVVTITARSAEGAEEFSGDIAGTWAWE